MPIFFTGVFMPFSARLKEVIEKTGLGREAFAQETGVSRRQLFNYLGEKSTPTSDFFQSIKRAFPWVNIEWLITGIGEMEGRGPRGVHQVANGNGHIMVGGALSGQIVGGVNTRQSGVSFSSKESRGAYCPVPLAAAKKDLEEIYALLCEYGSPKFLQELKDKLLQIKKIMDGD